MTAWATPADVSELTGATADDTQIAQAQGIIETFSGRVGAAANFEVSAGSAEWLRRAVAYQTVWMQAQPDLFERSDLSDLSQDGVTVRFRADGSMIAPLARKALRKVKWRGSRSVSTGSDWQPGWSATYPISEGVVAVYDQPGENWQPE
jgi:predicted ThiF/HesA family dinucleotide-utilizing enzyme